MQPLFQNQTTVDKAELLEWYKQELSRLYPGYRLLNVVLLALCLGVAGWCLYVRSLLGGAMFIVGCVVMLALAALMAVNLFFRHRIAVWMLLRKDGGRDYPSTLLTQFYRDEAVMMRLGRAALEAGAAEAYLQKTADLQARFGQLMREAQGLETAGVEGLERLRDELKRLSGQMEALTGRDGLIEGEQRLPHSAITGYLETKNLWVLYYDGTAVLLRRDGFPAGTAAECHRFLYDLLAAAAKASTDKFVKKALLRALADYFTQDNTQEVQR